jgi:hypothetical protein
MAMNRHPRCVKQLLLELLKLIREISKMFTTFIFTRELIYVKIVINASFLLLNILSNCLIMWVSADLKRSHRV